MVELEGYAAVVKKIVDVKVAKDGTRYFRICWKDTWEPEAHILSCQDMLEKFLNSRTDTDVTSTNNNAAINNEQKNGQTTVQEAQKIQCDLVNTTTNKYNIKTLKESVSSQKQIMADQVEKIPLHSDDVYQQNDMKSKGVHEKQHTDFSMQFNSCCDQHQMKDETHETTIFHTCQCSEQIESCGETREVGSQCEPNVRHFAVQSLNTVQECSVEVAEVSIQVETSVFSTGTQYVEPGKRYFKTKNSLCGKSTPTQCERALITPAEVTVEPVETISSAANHRTPIQQTTLADHHRYGFAQVSENPVNDIQEMSEFPNLVELDYSQIPADLLQQILSNTTTTAPAHLQQKPTEKDSNPADVENLKPMYFVVDGHSNVNNIHVEESESEIGDDQVNQININNIQPNQETLETLPVKKLNNIKPTRGRKRKSKEDPVEYPTTKNLKPNLGKTVYSRNLFPSDQSTPITVTTSENNKVKVQKVSQPLVNLPLSTVGVYPALGSPPQNLNESNVSVVSTVYEPNTPPFQDDLKKKKSIVRISDAISAKENISSISSLTTKEDQINNDFISKYWK